MSLRHLVDLPKTEAKLEAAHIALRNLLEAVEHEYPNADRREERLLQFLESLDVLLAHVRGVPALEPRQR